MLPWSKADTTEKEAFTTVFMSLMDDPEGKPEELHSDWRHALESRGWRLGDKYDSQKKETPLLCRYIRLHDNHRRKSHILKSLAMVFKKKV